MSTDKIYFAYPTLLTDGMTSSNGFIPDPLIAGIDKGLSQTLVVTAGMSLSRNTTTYTRIEVYHNGDLITEDDDDLDGYFENFKLNFVSGSQLIALSAMHLKNVIFQHSGTYELRLELFETDEDGKRKDGIIDNYSSYFYVLVTEEKKHGTDV